jgi:myo-inositol-1(or 4)-monophosphatase
VGEESYTGETFEANDYIWMVDPIDGTTNYLHQKQCFAISIALYQNGQGICGAIYNPSTDELFWTEKGAGAFLNNNRLFINFQSVEMVNSLIATFILYNEREKAIEFERFVHHIANESRGTRMIGCSSLELAYVACGRFNAYLVLFKNRGILRQVNYLSKKQAV